MYEWDHTNTREVNHVTGAFLLVRKKLFEILGGFDERFFVYLEDLDFSLRAYKAGWKTIYLADAHAFHKGGGTSEQVKPKRLFYSLRSRIRYGYKHFNFFSATLLLLGTLFIEPLSRLSLAVSRMSTTEVKNVFKGFAMLWQSMICNNWEEEE